MVYRGRVTTRQAILSGWLLCAVLDITAACLQAWMQAGRAPAEVLRGVASALWGAAAMKGGSHGGDWPRDALHRGADGDADLLRARRRITVLRTMPLWMVGPLYGVVVFCAMNYGTLPALSWLRSLYLHTAPRWPGSMSWPQLAITWCASACRSRGGSDAQGRDRARHARSALNARRQERRQCSDHYAGMIRQHARDHTLLLDFTSPTRRIARPGQRHRSTPRPAQETVS